MKTFALLLCALSTASAALILNDVAYMKLANCATSSTDMFSDSAFKAAYDPASRLLYVTGSKCVAVVSVENPYQPLILLKIHSFSDGNDGRIVDIALCGNTLAVLFESTFEISEGHVYMCSRYNAVSNDIQCDSFNQITVGESPKSMTFTNDCSKLLVANEGRAGQLNGVFTDPDGTVSIINMPTSAGITPCVRELSFTYFNDAYETYLTQGVRWSYRGDHNNGIVTRFSQDLEPEAIAISDDGSEAYVTLPESNAMAVINLVGDVWEGLYAMGTKDWTTLSMDASDADSGPLMVNNYEVKGMYQPTAAIFVQASSVSYVVTANTGAPKTYTAAKEGVDFTDSVRAQTAVIDGDIDQAVISSNLGYNLVTNNRLGRVMMSNNDGKSIINSLITDIHLFGGRDIGFWDPTTKAFRYSTGDELERRSLEFYPEVFNGDCSNATLAPVSERDSRSPYMGPEPNVLASGLFNTIPIVTAATRNGLVYVYSFSLNTPIYESVHRMGNTTAEWSQSHASSQAGDGLISDMGFIPQNSIGPNPFLFVISRATGSISVKELLNV